MKIVSAVGVECDQCSWMRVLLVLSVVSVEFWKWCVVGVVNDASYVKLERLCGHFLLRLTDK